MTVTKDELMKLVKIAWETAQEVDLESGQLKLPKMIMFHTDGAGRTLMNEPRWQLFHLLVNNLVPKYAVQEGSGTFEHRSAGPEENY